MFLSIIIKTIFQLVFIPASQAIENLDDDSAFIRAGIIGTWLPLFHLPSIVFGGVVVDVGDLTEVLGIMRRFVVFVVGVVVWLITFVVRSKVRYVVIRHGCSVVFSINRLCAVWEGARACLICDVNASPVSSSWCDPR